jgi:FkbM family methyltransferase
MARRPDLGAIASKVAPPARVRRLRARRPRRVLLRALDGVLARHPVSYARAPTPFGFTLAGETGDLLQRRVFVFGVWEPHISRWVRGFLRPGDVVLDIGANVGYFSLLCATRVGRTGRVIAFEPVPSVVECLRGNLELNGVDWVDVRPVIVSDEPGEAEIFRGPPRNLGRSTTSAEDASADDGFTSEGTIPKVRASDAVDEQLWERIRLVKIDTEGDELRTLQGLLPLLRSARTGTRVLVEVTPDELVARGGTPAEIFDLMGEAGFAEAYAVPNLYHVSAYVGDVPRDPEPLTAPPDNKADVLFVKT